MLSRGNRLQYADRMSRDMPIYYNSAAINLSVTLFICTKKKVLMLHLLWDFSHNLAISPTLIDAAASSVVNGFQPALIDSDQIRGRVIYKIC